MRLHIVVSTTKSSVMNEFRCFEVKIEESEKASHRPFHFLYFTNSFISSVRQDAPSMTCAIASWCSTHTENKTRVDRLLSWLLHQGKSEEVLFRA